MDPSTEHISDREFWSNKSLIIAAVDTFSARRYLNSKALLYNIPMLESGTGNQAASSSIVIPDLTEPYRAPNINMAIDEVSCTVKASPQTASHCIHWAKDRFEKYFIDLPSILNSGDVSENEVQKYGHFFTLWSKDQKASSDFIRCAKTQFYIDFRDDIAAQMETDIQKDFMQSSEFNINDQMHTGYIRAFSNILAALSNIELQPLSESEFLSLLEFEALSVGVEGFDANRFSNLENENLNATRFQKDENLESKNYHMDFVYFASILRARNFNISGVTRSDCRKIAGHVDPAVSIASSVISSLMSVEFYKLLIHRCDPNDVPNNFRSYDIDLRNLNKFIGSQSVSSLYEEVKKVPPSLKQNDVINFDIRGNPSATVQSVLDYLTETLFVPNGVKSGDVRFLSMKRYADDDLVLFQMDTTDIDVFNEDWSSLEFQELLNASFKIYLQNLLPLEHFKLNYIYLEISCTTNFEPTRIPTVW
eukprot:TRINITY_DN16463_c0_g1_i1.p1 TRINITY_DN16463_c0_g1~~TRINITY_DN16463_c0_g1_i1.p1  ORF type:complete len:478 (-),score=82.14 TRINITY_DN16463_c0_g1_i1:133-1566(-)